MTKWNLTKAGSLFVNIVILLNFFSTFLASVFDANYFLYIEFFCVVVFVVEIVVRIWKYKKSFFFCHKGEKRSGNNKIGWNYFDFSVTLVSVLGLLLIQTSSFASIRLIRVIRTARMFSMFSHNKSLQTMMSAMVESIKGIIVAVFALIIIFVIYAVIGSDLFGQEMPETFGDGLKAMLTLFQLMILDGWADVARPIINSQPIWGSIYFISFTFFTAFIMLNIITGVIVDSMAEVSRERRMKARKKDDRQEEILKKLSELELKIDSLSKSLDKEGTSEMN